MGTDGACYACNWWCWECWGPDNGQCYECWENYGEVMYGTYCYSECPDDTFYLPDDITCYDVCPDPYVGKDELC